MAVGVGVPIPILNEEILKFTTITDRDIKAPVIDYSYDYPNKTGKSLATVTYEELKSGKVNILGKEIESSSMSSYEKALKIANILKARIADGKFHLAEPFKKLPENQKMKSLIVKD